MLLHCSAFLLNRCVNLISFINHRLKCREESLISSNGHQDVFQRINVMPNDPTEELSQTFNERDVALRRQKRCNMCYLSIIVFQYLNRS